MNVDLKWQCCPSPYCNIPKKPLIGKRTPTVTHLFCFEACLRQRRRRAKEQDGQLENEWWKLGDKVVGDEVGEVYKFGVWPFRWYLHSHTHVEKLKLIFEFSSKNRFWHPEIDFASVKSIWNRFYDVQFDQFFQIDLWKIRKLKTNKNQLIIYKNAATKSKNSSKLIKNL